MKGHCLCGAVGVVIEAPQRGPSACHCGMCRRWHGALGVYSRGGSLRQVRGVEHVRWYASSPGAERGFCALCGSKLFWREAGEDALDVAMGLLDPPTGVKIDRHIWVAHKGDYYDIADGLPQFAESSDDAEPMQKPAPKIDPPASPIESRRGHCLCGQVAFRVSGKMHAIVMCHCRQCLRQHGHVSAYSSAPWADVVLEKSSTLRWYRSSAEARRGFCGECGSSLFWEPLGEDRVSICAGALEPPTGLKPLRHIFVADKGDYYDITDELPRNPHAS